jgi:tight adherence protein C
MRDAINAFLPILIVVRSFVARTLDGESLPLVIAAGTFIVTILLLVALFVYVGERAKHRRLLTKISQPTHRLERPLEEMEASGVASTIRQTAVNFFSAVGERANRGASADYSHVRMRFLRAGWRGRHTPAVFWGVKTVLMFTLPVLFFTGRLSVLRVFQPSVTLAICVCLAFVGFYVPNLWLRMTVARRKDKLQRGLPDALDLLTVAVEAGLGLDAAINRVADEIRLSCKELSDELKLLNLELRAGKPRRDALRNLAVRTDLEDIRSLVTLLIQTEKFGTSVAKALRVHADSFRTQLYQRAEETAAKLPVKLVIPLILFIFPSLYVTILGPAAIRLFDAMLHH